MPVIEWLELFSEQHADKAAEQPRDFHFNFEYFNSTSAKYILDVFKTLGSLQSKGAEVRVKWHYEEDDEDMLEVGQEMSRMSKLPFEYIKS